MRIGRPFAALRASSGPRSGERSQHRVIGIPQTVIVGKDGSVQAVHVGVLPNLKEQLIKELDALVAGKRLTGPPEGAPEPGGEAKPGLEKGDEGPANAPPVPAE